MSVSTARSVSRLADIADTARVADLRLRVREAMEHDPEYWQGPPRIDDFSGPIAIRKARAIALKLARMPVGLWDGQLIAGSMTFEIPRLHAEGSFPEYLTAGEVDEARSQGLGTGCFGHIVPDYPRLLSIGLEGIRNEASDAIGLAETDEEQAFLHSVIVAIDGVLVFASRLADHCASFAADAAASGSPPVSSSRARELEIMASNLRQVPAGPATTFWQGLQSVWLLHMIFHSTKNGNAVGRLDQYAWPLLEDDLESGRLDLAEAAELVDCFTLKFNERAKTTEDQHPERRVSEPVDRSRRTRHGTSSQIGTTRDRVDATNHWLQNIIIGGLTPEGTDGTNPLSHLLIRSYLRNRMTNPLITVRVHEGTPDDLLLHACETLKEGGGMPAFFSDEALVPALVRLGIPEHDARDYTNDGCWEVIIPGRTDFVFQRLSVMLCLEWALNRGRSRITGEQEGVDSGDPRAFSGFDDVWSAFAAQLDAMVSRTVESVVARRDDRYRYAPVPLLSALIDGPIKHRRDMTAGGATYRTYGMLAEGAAHAIDSLTAIASVIFGDRANGVSASIGDLCDALACDYEGYERLRRSLQDAPKYGNDHPVADAMGKRLIEEFTASVHRHASKHREVMLFPCGVGTFSWYIGIGEGLGASADGRRAGNPVSSNFSPALGMDMAGIPAAILSYGSMPHAELPAGGPLDLRIARKLVEGEAGTSRLAGLVRGFVESGGAMLTLTVADTEELLAAQRDPDGYRSLRVRMGGWCAYFTALSREQQDHHIRRQEAKR